MNSDKHLETCYHCGEDCKDEIIKNEEEKSFCCNGCHMVYELLQENDLSDYYKLNNQPGVRQKGRSQKDKLAYLDDETIRRKLIDFTDGGVSKLSFYLPQIHCSSCIWLLEKLPALHGGVHEAKVNFLKREIYITFSESKLTLRALVELLINLGYEPLINLEDLEKNKKKEASREQEKSFYIKFGVVGFCFGNIMMLSFPEYLGITVEDQSFIELFGYLNILLSIPVFFYGARDYLTSAWNAIRHWGVNIDVPISLGIMALMFRSLYEIFTETGAGYLDSLGALIFLLLIGKWFQQKTFDNISFERDYKSYFPIAVTRIVKGVQENIPLSKLAVHDTLIIKNGELIPADAILKKGVGEIDYSFVTGESKPIKKLSGDGLYAGGKQMGGVIEVETTKEVSQSYLTRLWNEQTFQEEDTKAFLQTKTNIISKWFTLIILLVACIAGGYWWSVDGATHAVNTFTSVLIIACPCALALNAPFALGNSMRIMARFGLFPKDTEAVEKMSSINHLVFDKTGTITSAKEQAINFEGEELSEQDKALIYAVTSQSTHPVSSRIAQSLVSFDKKIDVENFKEVEASGIEGIINGKLIKLGKASFVNADNSMEKTFQTVSYVCIDNKVLGRFTLAQSLRKDIDKLMYKLNTKGYKISLLSGDNSSERKKLEQIFPNGTTMHFEQSPQDKMNFISKNQEKGDKVLMIGDGLNDAGALKQANIGIAVAEDAHQFSPACDGILAANKVKKLAMYLRFSKAATVMVYVGFVISFLYNILGLSYAVQGNLSPLIAAILMPLSSISVVLIGMLGTTMSGARLLGK
ncbi:heavy metal translocating P-type ATPase [Flammeovirga kamogawensis]|uniref:Heavy metal translocating P-type ATPase metal-binding domain-containing protein n=1 Tax=Flammeovirga kamogawensis TaxID=373891 RepID=A0ABX8H0J7_9BACT|nr:heavy metal translocating P-type ATPase metal-binding domain-containing protein [Flammeovirga kamogawensis]MBB6459365.1 Cu+-exporting ATPase [Flammeovirga kamogawensis]QWG08922.1 heavy metal translocating P-type ATPase metal-binding domain-containing protein [Flammeovirga kamogawensis]